MPETWDITDDSELRDAVRTETQYDDGKLTTEDLKGLVKSAKRVMALKADVTSFYDDRGLTVALLGVVCAKAKGAVENQPVRVDNIGAGDTTFRTSDGSSLQLAEYEEMTQLGLTESEKTDAGTHEIHLTGTYYSDNSSR